MAPISRLKVSELSGIPWHRRKLRNRKAHIPWAVAPEKTGHTPLPAPAPPSPGRLAHLAEGAAAERLALRFLECRGLLLVAQNHRCKCGELDLVMAQGNTAVVVEVRLRNNRRHGSALESVSRAKQLRISRCASLWWVQQGQPRFTHLRFDVVAVESGNEPVWVQNAWQISN